MGTGKQRSGVSRKRAGQSAPKTARAGGKQKQSAPKTVRAGGKKKTSRKGSKRRSAGNPELFEPLTEGERADALRLLIEDRRLAKMAKVGRYRVVSTEPLAVKPPHPLCNHRLARVIIYDYASACCVEALIDLDLGGVAHLATNKSQPVLAVEEEMAAIDIALTDERVKGSLGLGDQPIAAMHYWSETESDLAHTRRSAAVLFGSPGSRPNLVAVVDLLDGAVHDVVPGENW